MRLLLLNTIIGLIVSAGTIAQGYTGIDPTKAPSDKTPSELEGVGIKENLGGQLDLNLQYLNERGESLPLATYFHQNRPVVMMMIYYSCPSLCNFQLNGLVDVLKNTKGTPGKDYELVAVSMDHSETPELAAAKKETYVKALGQVEANDHWHFLVGSEQNVKALAQQLGFSFKWDESQKQFAHAAATYVVTPQGVLSRYLNGIAFDAQTLRFSLVEASRGKIGSIIEQLALFCFQFDPHKNKYTLYAFNLVRIGALLTLLVLAIFLVPQWLGHRKSRA